MKHKAPTIEKPSRRSGEGVSVESIKEELRTRIQSGQLPEGAAVPSEHELAARFGVNRNHTRLALRDLALEGYILRTRGRRSVVAPRTAEREGASSLYGRTTIALVQPECMTRFCHDVVNGFTSRATELGLQTVVYSLRFDDESELGFLKHVRELGLQGIALWLQHDTDETRSLLSDFVIEGFPFVLLDRYVPEVASDCVVTDNEALAYHLTLRLIEHGHRRIGFVSDSFDYSSTRDRHAGYVKALRESDLEPEERFVVNLDLVRDGAKSVINSVMAHREVPTGFFCVHDSAARLLASELRRLGYQIPEHIEIATVDDEHYAAELGIPMVTARQPSYEIGREAAEILACRLKDPERAAERRILPPLFSNDPMAERAGTFCEGATHGRR